MPEEQPLEERLKELKDYYKADLQEGKWDAGAEAAGILIGILVLLGIFVGIPAILAGRAAIKDK